VYNNIMPFPSWCSIASPLPQDRGAEDNRGATQEQECQITSILVIKKKKPNHQLKTIKQKKV
jgi:hypothetical protein